PSTTVEDQDDAAAAIASDITTAAAGGVTAADNSATITITGATPTTNPATSLIISAYQTTASGSVNAKDAVKSVSLYSNSEELDTVTLNSDGKAVFEDINFTVEAGITTDLVVKVNLNNIGTNSSDTAKSGHTFSTELTLVEAKGTESGEVLDPNGVEEDSNGVAIDNDTVAATSIFLVTNNKLQVAKLDQSTTLAGGVADLLKFKLFDASTDGDRAEVKKITFNLTGNSGVDLSTGSYELVGGNQVITCSDNFGAGPAVAGAVTCDFSSTIEEISAAGTTFVLKATGITVTPDDTVTTKLVVNSSAVGADGVEWLDGGDGSETTANGVPVQWIDFGESDESTTYILNVVSN
ncbi:TPA: hypothetical protein EYG96_02940, partial [Candidatus Gracilibacteria bacterium]|nr:hypothetical protein [Candidatus Gracilibacteria bacterium]